MKIAELKNIIDTTDVEHLPEVMERFSTEESAGAKQQLLRAKKRYEAYRKECERTEAMQVYERKYSDYSAICGIDEVGRGPLAGPVVAAAVILPRPCNILYLNDSKQLSEAKREELYDVIITQAVAVGIGVVSHTRIDEINILQATYEAMRQAVGKLSVVPDLLLNDAVTIPGLPMKQVPIIKGDAKSSSIAAASIVAKVTRDRMMVELDRFYPGYGFASNKGYGSKEHIHAIQTLGPSDIHRRSFIKNFYEGSDK
ncbi:MAG: ribonuclease HII [Lachnospiraceae bacterium]